MGLIILDGCIKRRYHNHMSNPNKGFKTMNFYFKRLVIVWMAKSRICTTHVSMLEKKYAEIDLQLALGAQ